MRYEFGENWSDFIASNFNENKVEHARSHMLNFIGIKDLKGLKFLDIGCGSGLHSLAALQAEADCVTSFDIDKNAVDSAKSIKKKYGEPENWTILEGSILDPDFTSKLREYDVIYSWGVLHHTGNMWAAIESARNLMKKNSLLYLALYSSEACVNPKPEYWLDFKRRYNRNGKVKRMMMELLYFLRFYIWHDVRSNLRNVAIFLLNCFDQVPTKLIPSEKLNSVVKICTFGKIPDLGTRLVRNREQPYTPSPFKNPFKYFWRSGRERNRGMDCWTDIRDWLGGYPMEFASNAETKRFCKDRLGLECLNIRAGEACTEYLFCNKEDKKNKAGFIPYGATEIIKGPFLKFGSVGWKFKITNSLAEKIQSTERPEPSLMILESSVPLGWEINASSEREISIIAEKGKGRHALINDWLYFSASDNSSPRDNGQTYEIGIMK